MRRAALLAVPLVVACRSHAEPASTAPPADLAGVRQGAAWIVERSGPSPALSTRDGELWVFFFAEPIAGVAFGDAKGPRLGLLGGQFAPLVAMPHSDRSYRIAIEADETLRASFASDTETVHLEIRPPLNRWIGVRMRGAPFALIPADRTDVRGLVGSVPSFARTLTSGEQPQLTTPKADLLEIRTTQLGNLRIEGSCPRPAIVEPTLRGATSVFLVRYGPPPLSTEPLYSAGELGRPIPAEACLSTATSTLSLAWPLP
jgi:hypothetical protein